MMMGELQNKYCEQSGDDCSNCKLREHGCLQLPNDMSYDDFWLMVLELTKFHNKLQYENWKEKWKNYKEFLDGRVNVSDNTDSH